MHPIARWLVVVFAAGTFASSARRADAVIWPGTNWLTATPTQMGMDATYLAQARNYALGAGGAGMVTRSGYVVDSWGDTSAIFELKSSTKSIGGMLLSMAIADGRVTLDQTMRTYFPTAGVPPQSNEGTGWLPLITLHELAVHSSGFDEPNAYVALIYPPNNTWYYSNCAVDWLADVLTIRFNQDLLAVLQSRVLTPIGVHSGQFTWRLNSYRSQTLNGNTRREFASGTSASCDAMARLGYLQLRGGAWNGTQILPSWYLPAAYTGDPTIASLPNGNPTRYPGATHHYGLLWWNNSDGSMAFVPRDACWAWGFLDSVILVIPSLDVVAVRAGPTGWQNPWTSDYSIVAPFIQPIARSCTNAVSVEDPTIQSWAKLHATFR
jgi:CubicO group peptidase (beta-lactamase class C family)